MVRAGDLNSEDPGSNPQLVLLNGFVLGDFWCKFTTLCKIASWFASYQLGFLTGRAGNEILTWYWKAPLGELSLNIYLYIYIFIFYVCKIYTNLIVFQKFICLPFWWKNVILQDKRIQWEHVDVYTNFRRPLIEFWYRYQIPWGFRLNNLSENKPLENSLEIYYFGFAWRQDVHT